VLFGGFVFMSASFMALSKDFFKEILGLSTIALLALMMSIAAIGTVEAKSIALILIVFHAISKALLFLQACILEKQFHLKYLCNINGLVSRSKFVVFFILIGFASLTLPPFGAFIGKFLTIELLADLISKNILFLFALIFILLGSVFLTLLYFKVLTKLLCSNSTCMTKEQVKDKIPLTFLSTSLALVGLLFFGIYEVYLMGYMSLDELLIPSSIFILSLILLMMSSYKSAHRVKEYNCGEKDEVEIQPFYFQLKDKHVVFIRYIAIIAFLAMIIIGAM